MPRGVKGTGISYKTYSCLHCGKENVCGGSKFNKYCDTNCKASYEYTHKYVPLVESGQCNAGSSPLRRYILERDNYTCTECGCGEEYNGKSLTLQLDHIDGNSDNNFPVNLRTLCPNCHSQTDTYGSKGQGSRYKKVSKRNQYLQSYKNGSLAQR